MTRHVTEQLWLPEVREDGVYLVAADDRSVVLKLCRPDRGSDLLIAGYVAGLQMGKVHEDRQGLRTCSGCGRSFAMLYICERCGRCDQLDLPRDADRPAPCCDGGARCVEIDWRAADTVGNKP